MNWSRASGTRIFAESSLKQVTVIASVRKVLNKLVYTAVADGEMIGIASNITLVINNDLFIIART